MASTIKSNTVTNATASTLTLGESGTTVTLACGATQSGFGRTGTVDWCTTAKTGPLTAVSGKGYMINTCGGAVTVTLPSSPSAGDIVSLADYKSTWAVACKPVTVGRAGSKINGTCYDATLAIKGQSITLVYIDGTQGWKSVQDSTSDVTGAPAFIAASGGNATITSGDYKTHIFTADGPLNVTSAGSAGGSTVLDYFVNAGGGAGGITSYGGGGGAGGFRLYTTAPGSNSPLNAPAGLTATVADFTITVGGGGSAPTPLNTNKGSDSVFGPITSAGGGTGRIYTCTTGMDGGSGAGGNADGPTPFYGSGNTPSVSPPQGNDGGASGSAPNSFGGGGGGAGAVGKPGTDPSAGYGGIGTYIADPLIGPTAPSYGSPGPTGSTRYFGGGGGGGSNANMPYPGTPAQGASGGGNGGVPGYPSQPGYIPGGQAGTAATVNTGSGGGGAGYGPAPVNIAGAGGSGIVMIRYKFQ